MKCTKADKRIITARAVVILFEWILKNCKKIRIPSDHIVIQSHHAKIFCPSPNCEYGVEMVFSIQFISTIEDSTD